MSKQNSIDVLGIYSKVEQIDKKISLVEARIEPERIELKKLEKDRSILVEQLKVSIPPNTAKSNIFHKVTQTKSYRYAEIYKAIVEHLVPRVKQPEAESIKEANVTIGEKHSFERMS